ncbi:MAG: sugar phosphate isomerase/epimerase family protein [Desulforhopalus sp.]
MRNPVIVSTAAYDGYGWETIFQSLAGLNVELVELAFIVGYTEPFSEDYFSAENAQLMKELLTRYQLRCCSFSSHVDLGTDGIVELFKKRMAFAQEIGATTIVTNASILENKNVFYKNIQELASYGADLQLMIGLENPGDGRPNVIDQGKNCQQVIDRINSSWVGINYDFGNLVSHCFGGVQPELDYLSCKQCTVHYHIKDVAQDSSGYYFPPIGQGSIDYRKILTDLAGDSPSIPLSLEIPLRLSRDTSAQPIRRSTRVPLDEIESILQQSLEFVIRNISPKNQNVPQ